MVIGFASKRMICGLPPPPPTVTVTLAFTEPPGPVAVNVYVVVVFGVTVELPVLETFVPTPGWMLTLVAFCTTQVRVELSPGWI
jgi:hypothetical protein